MRRHAEAQDPEECCGILIGRASPEQIAVLDVILTDNVAADRKRRYDIDPRQLLRAHRQVRLSGHEVVGYFHSHPMSEPMPSKTDRQHAWPDTSYLILGLEAGQVTEVRSWRLRSASGDFEEEELICL